LSKLEEKFFMHSYDREPEDSRLERLEEMVFGGRKAGSAEQRKARLSAAMTVPAPVGVGAGDATGQGESESSSRAPVDSQLTADSAADEADAAYSVPAVRNREPVRSEPQGRWDKSWQAHYRQAEVGRPGSDTVSSGAWPAPEQVRSPVASRPTSDSVSRSAPAYQSESAAMPQPAPDFTRKSEPVALAPPYAVHSNRPGSIQSAAPPLTTSGQILERVGALELQAFGITFQSNPLPNRLARLEWNQFPGVAARTDLPITARVDRLASDRSGKMRFPSGGGNALY
jgi:hypothetical protein